MHKEGHIGASLLVYSPVGVVAMLLAGEQLALLGAVAAVGLAMLPDVDRRIPLVKHRGVTHTAWFALAVGVIMGALGVLHGADVGLVGAVGGGLFGLALGAGAVAAHIAADALTPAGVRPFWPWRGDELRYGVARASNPIANYVLLGVGCGVALLGLLLGRALG